MTRKPRPERRRTETDVTSPETSLGSSDPFHPDEATDPMRGVVAIHAVTSEMMDEAARKAAEAVDDIAHRSSASAGVVADAPTASVEAAAEQAMAPTDRPLAIASRTAQDAVSAGTAAGGLGREVDHAATRGMLTSEGAASHAGAVADRVGHAIPQDVSGPADALVQYNTKLLDAVRANMAATGDLCTALMSAKSLPEVVALNADHVGRQMHVMTTQGRELVSLAQKLAFGALQPLKAMAMSRFQDR